MGWRRRVHSTAVAVAHSRTHPASARRQLLIQAPSNVLRRVVVERLAELLRQRLQARAGVRQPRAERPQAPAQPVRTRNVQPWREADI